MPHNDATDKPLPGSEFYTLATRFINNTIEHAVAAPTATRNLTTKVTTRKGAEEFSTMLCFALYAHETLDRGIGHPAEFRTLGYLRERTHYDYQAGSGELHQVIALHDLPDWHMKKTEGDRRALMEADVLPHLNRLAAECGLQLAPGAVQYTGPTTDHYDALLKECRDVIQKPAVAAEAKPAPRRAGRDAPHPAFEHLSTETPGVAGYIAMLAAVDKTKKILMDAFTDKQGLPGSLTIQCVSAKEAQLLAVAIHFCANARPPRAAVMGEGLEFPRVDKDYTFDGRRLEVAITPPAGTKVKQVEEGISNLRTLLVHEKDHLQAVLSQGAHGVSHVETVLDAMAARTEDVANTRTYNTVLKAMLAYGLEADHQSLARVVQTTTGIPGRVPLDPVPLVDRPGAKAPIVKTLPPTPIDWDRDAFTTPAGSTRKKEEPRMSAKERAEARKKPRHEESGPRVKRKHRVDAPNPASNSYTPTVVTPPTPDAGNDTPAAPSFEIPGHVAESMANMKSLQKNSGLIGAFCLAAESLSARLDPEIDWQKKLGELLFTDDVVYPVARALEADKAYARDRGGEAAFTEGFREKKAAEARGEKRKELVDLLKTNDRAGAWLDGIEPEIPGLRAVIGAALTETPVYGTLKRDLDRKLPVSGKRPSMTGQLLGALGH